MSDYTPAHQGGIDTTGIVVAVISHTLTCATVKLDSGVLVRIQTTHLPRIGDAVVEGELRT